MAEARQPGGAFDARSGVRFGQRALVVHPVLDRRAAEPSDRDVSARLDEICGLARAIRLEIAAAHAIRVRQPSPATLLGSGQVERLADEGRALGAELLVVDGELAPVQQKNLEEATGLKVVDRTGLILEIFGARAATAEGRMQVELAHLEYQAGRLVRSWTHLERQRGGFGFLGGPGETQIETDRRLLRERMGRLRRQLADVRRTRSLQRERRQRVPWPAIALVGYTNAGKSTLFNRLSGAGVHAADQLFATLDPTMRAIQLPGFPKAILADTVGFVSALPTQLVAAFRATLEEVTEADLLVHVRDIAHPDSEAQAADVRAVLEEIGALAHGTPLLEAWNKEDLLPADAPERARAEREGAILVSASTGQGLETLRAAMAAALAAGAEVREIRLHPSDGLRLAWLYEHAQVLDRREEGGTIAIIARLSAAEQARFERL